MKRDMKKEAAATKRARHFARYLNRKLELKGLSQTELKEMSGVGHVADLCSGKGRNVSVETLEALASAIGDHPHDLFDAACGVRPGSRPRQEGVEKPMPDASEFVQLLQEIVVNPALIELVEDARDVPPEDLAVLLKAAKMMGSVASKQVRKRRTS